MSPRGSERPRREGQVTHPVILAACIGIVLIAALCGAGPSKTIHHYMFVDRERQRIEDEAFLSTPALEGAQVKYTWKELEPEADEFDFARIRHDLAFLTEHGKKLFVQVQDVSFDGAIVPVPAYLQQDPRFHGGVARQWPDDTEDAVPAGWVARRFDPAVQARFATLLAALGAEFDGKVEGINLAETAVEFGESGRRFPEGFTPEAYRDGVIANLRALQRAFRQSVAVQYANFMPGEWLPDDDHGYLRDVYRAARELKVGVGGPDLLPGKPGQMKHSYPLIEDASADVPVAIAVQDDNQAFTNPQTKRRVTIEELNAFASDSLHADYVFWCTQEPYWSNQVLPFLRRAKD